MGFQIGDKVIHSSFGLGEITQIEEKTINGDPTKCYVVQTPSLTTWIPVDNEKHNCLRLPITPKELAKVLKILSTPNESLVEDRILRKQQLQEQLSDGNLTSICRLIRDLTGFQRITRLSDQEKYILERATKTLLDEWSLSLNITPNQAHSTLQSMLA